MQNKIPGRCKDVGFEFIIKFFTSSEVYFYAIPPEICSSYLEKVRGFPSLGKLQQIVCEWCKILRAWRLCFVWCWCSWGSGRASEGRLAGSGSVRGRRSITCSQCFVCVFARCPIYKSLQCWGEGWTQTFRCEAATKRFISGLTEKTHLNHFRT